MPKLDLFTVFSAALESCRTPSARAPAPNPPSPAPTPAMDDDFLLAALRNSTTARDQIMQRRLGTLPDTAEG
jgi:hypothetical protein